VGSQRSRALSVYLYGKKILLIRRSCGGFGYGTKKGGFSEELSVAGTLGRTGFFDAFRVTFDHSEHPPILEINRIEHKNVH